MPVTALVTPGPEVTRATPTSPVAAGVAVGGVDRRLLVADQDVLDRVLLVERVVDVEDRAAGVAPEVADVFGLQAADQDFGAVRLGGRRRGAGSGRRGARFSVGR